LARIQIVPVKLLTDEAFRPFGETLAPKQRQADFQGVNSTGWKANFDIDGVPVIMTLLTTYKRPRFTRMERHFAVSQTFIPLGRIPSVVAVAAPTDRATVPLPEDITAFVIDGSMGYVLRMGTWHSLDRYPLYPPSSQAVIITSVATQTELETVTRREWKLTQEIDYAAKFGVTFEFDLSGITLP
jgi:ureidoglycolate hydrolase